MFYLSIFFQHDFGKIFYQEPAVFVLEIQNTGLTPTHFVFKPSGKNESFENWLTITPKSSFLDVGLVGLIKA